MSSRTMNAKRLIPLLVLGLSAILSACAVPTDVTREPQADHLPEAPIVESGRSLFRPSAQIVSRNPIAPEAGAAPQILQRGQVNVIGNDNGGDLIEYAQMVSRARRQSAQVAFSGNCASACTLYLSLSPSQTCITRGASFVFHRAYGARPDVNQWGTDYMLARYPDWVQRWIDQRGGLSDRLMRMDYAYASRFLRRCRFA